MRLDPESKIGSLTVAQWRRLFRQEHARAHSTPEERVDGRRWLSVREAAEYAGVKPTAIYSATTRGKLRKARARGGAPYLKSDVDAWLGLAINRPGRPAAKAGP